MLFDFKLMLRMYVKSFTRYKETGAKFTAKRLIFLLSFPLWFGFLEIFTWI